MPGSIHSNTTGGSVGHGGSTVALGGTAVYSYGAGGADGGGYGGGGWRRRNFVGSAGAAARAGYGFLVTTDLEPGIGGDRRALWTCFCSFKTRRKRCVRVPPGRVMDDDGRSAFSFWLSVAVRQLCCCNFLLHVRRHVVGLFSLVGCRRMGTYVGSARVTPGFIHSATDVRYVLCVPCWVCSIFKVLRD